jgi:hypothetical protein
MTKPEMHRRIEAMNREIAREVHHLLLTGYGTAGVQFETGASIKQINAVAEWINHYGRIVPNL